eukprot:gene64948-biopygen47553
MALVTVSPHVIPPPAGVNVSDVASMKASLHLFEAKHFLFPFLAHALGTFTGALVAFLVAGSRRTAFAYTIGCLFLAGGIAACFMLPAPAWFMALDLVVSYLPMAWLATRVGPTGLKLTEPTSSSITVWTRITRDAERAPDVTFSDIVTAVQAVQKVDGALANIS